MPLYFRLISEYFWLVALIFGVVNYLRSLGMLAKSGASGPDSEAGTYLKRFAIGANLPWVVMGIGQMSGYTPMVWYYFRPQDGNPFVIAWLATILATSSVYSYWVLFAGGAQKVIDYNLLSAIGQRKGKWQTLWSVKLLAAFGPVFLPVWIYFVASMNVPILK